MKGSILAAVALGAADVSAHYIFQQLQIGGTKYPLWQGIRQHSNYNSPVTDLSSPDLRCNVGAGNGGNTQTVSARAGDSVTFFLDTPVYHQGPVSLYMSKAPGSASNYDGSGGWFKIYDWGPTISGSGASWKLDGSYTANIPSCIPDGEYLIRIQSLGIHNPWPAGIPQFYISCAQVKVTGGGSASPATVSIPGAFRETDPGYTANIYSNLRSYTVPGPSVFTCSGGGGGGGNTNPNPPPAQTTMVTTTRAPTTPTTAPAPGGCTVARYGQCGGNGYSGCTTCASGSTCSRTNDWYSQSAAKQRKELILSATCENELGSTAWKLVDDGQNLTKLRKLKA
ncbi:glycosyl hydrolase family 61-domain-containing protein [Podospora aff. communis PSN243]|uniref:lytic cellulose monooxygenase (C4-dehydrogenating) n=1 Tax=Podospora aff. communis PSN243 TaxID=3040156 RepID=A0AAV9GL14_9PEZI|nr:glycosyl hydrolase family 61-domain-containing protein [Podospora aff. communis PSN243]